jgi:hypothetical protein
MLEHLLSKCEALSSNPSIAKKKKKEIDKYPGLVKFEVEILM